MRIASALVEFAYSKHHSPTSQRWYRSRLGAFTAWRKSEGVVELEGIIAPLVRCCLDHRRRARSRTGSPATRTPSTDTHA
jgi:hypothetical protein